MAAVQNDETRAADFMARVRCAFPDLAWEEARYLGHGWDHDVLVLDRSLVLRAPRDERYRMQFGEEIRLLDHLHGLVGLPIPHYTLIAADDSVAGYQALPGVELEPGLLERLHEADRRRVASAIAEFLTVLHAIRRADLARYELRSEDEASLFAELSERVAKQLSPRLQPGELALIQEYLRPARTQTAGSYDPVLIHCDLTPDHLLWDTETKTLSVIDFSDRAYGDPARDFAGLLDYGADFLTQVVERYEGQREGLLERAELYHKRLPLWLMIDALDGFPCSFEDGYRMFQRCFPAADGARSEA